MMGSKSFYYRLCVLLLAAFSVCGCSLFNRTKPIAVIDLEKVRAAHPRYVYLTRAKDNVTAMERVRQQQITASEEQIRLLEKMQGMKRSGYQNYLRAEYTSKLAEKETVELDALRKKERLIREKAEERTVDKRRTIEEKYRLPILNLRLKLQNIKMYDAAKENVIRELEDTLAAKQAEELALDREQQREIAARLAQEQKAHQQKVRDFALKQKQFYEKKAAKLAGLPRGRAELARLTQSLDKQVALKQRSYEALADSIDADIRQALRKLETQEKYSLVIASPKGIGTAVDITAEVCQAVKRLND